MRAILRVAVTLVLSVTLPMRSGLAAEPQDDEFLRHARAFMRETARGNRVDAARIKKAYSELTIQAALLDRDALTAALAAATIRPLPRGSSELRVRPRLTGPHRIGEADPAHQHLYVAAHPAAIECLLRISSSMRTGPLDVTSLVRHRVYQATLAAGNPNATRAGSLHTVGLAFDISVLNVPSTVARDLARVLLQMRASGDLYFLAETRQLVFHVVPSPARLAEFADVTTTVAMAGEPALLPRPSRALAVRGRPLPMRATAQAAILTNDIWALPLGVIMWLAGSAWRRRRRW
jgi:hypothetical protein